MTFPPCESIMLWDSDVACDGELFPDSWDISRDENDVQSIVAHPVENAMNVYDCLLLGTV